MKKSHGGLDVFVMFVLFHQCLAGVALQDDSREFTDPNLKIAVGLRARSRYLCSLWMFDELHFFVFFIRYSTLHETRRIQGKY